VALLVHLRYNYLEKEGEEMLAGKSGREVNLGDPAMILYISGTTGPPKVQLLREGRGAAIVKGEQQVGGSGGSSHDTLHQWHYWST
jgi:acyl-coenzyme A synthetase/AMP-(fatty) acid ligase